MLVKVYRHGPTRQRLLKGYIAASKSSGIGENILHDWPRDARISLHLDPKQPACIWLDTGAVWLHTASARAEVFEDLANAATDLAARVGARGGRLLPNAVRTDASEDWKNF
jgi:hypothetical protein